MIKKLYLVVDAEGEARLVKRPSYVRAGEAAIELRINIPSGWGRVVGAIEVAVPEPPTVTSVDGQAWVVPTGGLAPTPPGEVGSEA